MASLQDFPVDEEVMVETEVSQLECHDSSFDESSDSEESEEEDLYFPVLPELEGDGEVEVPLGARPYMFQPRVQQGDAPRRPIVVETDIHRLENLDW